ncbi:hypothetical protein [Candidatus Protochlamydia naegleriophila]|uniref:hypothetical protein n=1 Tax=Candidatus Protochlamydia naegleriophila TaxID=389348 RepID=UPI0013016287|nr:hypothetical protein [Candidatus Protochlamydia naegleriophila]
MKDRLGAFYHWDDRQGLEQTINICLEQAINLSEVERWSDSEGFSEEYEIFLKRLKNAK